MKKVAIVIGHAPDKRGSCSAYLPCEYDYNKGVAEHLKQINPQLYEVYAHDSYAGGYYAMQQRTAGRINKTEYDLAVELHYNSYGDRYVKGSEVLCYVGSPRAQQYGKRIVDALCKGMDTVNRGVKLTKTRYDNGYWFTVLTKAPAVILEPFFGSNEFDCLRFGDPKLYAACLNDIIVGL